jgi:hypothetical protein
MMFCQKNFQIVAEVILVTGFASTHLVLDYDNGKGVVSLGWCEFAYDIDALPLQGP